jgi:16S rRNA (uracil1498-N3)-methyltransferase
MLRTRIHIDQPLHPNTDVELSGDRAHYIGRVLRLQPGDDLTLLNGRGGEYRAVIRTIGKRIVGLSLGEHIKSELESPLSIHLLQGVSRGERMDFVVQKATELGVARVTPIITDYSVVRLAPVRAQKRALHWRGIAASACEQCGRNLLPDIDEPISLRNWLGENGESSGSRLILTPGTTDSLASVDGGAMMMTLLVGPEGGFSEAEYELAAATGFHALNLGPRILRTETAAIAALAVLQALFGDLTGR